MAQPATWHVGNDFSYHSLAWVIQCSCDIPTIVKSVTRNYPLYSQSLVCRGLNLHKTILCLFHILFGHQTGIRHSRTGQRRVCHPAAALLLSLPCFKCFAINSPIPSSENADPKQLVYILLLLNQEFPLPPSNLLLIQHPFPIGNSTPLWVRS